MINPYSRVQSLAYTIDMYLYNISLAQIITMAKHNTCVPGLTHSAQCATHVSKSSHMS